MNSFILLAITSILSLHKSHGFANWLTTDFCDRSLVVGEVIMNEVIVYSDLRALKVLRDGSDISSSGFYYPGEKLTVQLSDTSNQYVIETINGRIENGGCEGRRIADKNNIILVMPELDADESEVSIWAGWAVGHSQVSITESLKFAPSKQTKPLVGSGAGRSQVLASKIKVPQPADEKEDDDDDEEVHEPKLIHKGRIDFKTTKKKKKSTTVDPEDLMYNKNAKDKHLRGGKKDHISSVDTASVFESRSHRRVIDNSAAVAAAAAKVQSKANRTPVDDFAKVNEDNKISSVDTAVDEEERVAPPALNSKRRGSAVHFDHEEGIKEAKKVIAQRKIDKKATKKTKTEAKLDESWWAHLAHIKLTFFEGACVGVILALFVGTLAYQICTGKFKFQYLRHYKLRGGGKSY